MCSVQNLKTTKQIVPDILESKNVHADADRRKNNMSPQYNSGAKNGIYTP